MTSRKPGKSELQPIDMGDLLERIKDRQSKARKYQENIGKFSLTEAQILELLSHVNDLRDYTLIQLAVTTGIRREDIVSIEVKDVDLKRQLVTFHEQKKSRSWSAYLWGDSPVTLERYLKTIDRRERFLFPGRSARIPSKTHLTGRAAYDLLQKWLKATGLEERPFHALRSSCMKMLLRKGWTIEQVMRQTGDTAEVIQEHYTIPSDSEMTELARRTR